MASGDMDAAAAKAAGEFNTMYTSLSEEEKEGVRKLVAWLKGNFMQAGYKRLCRFLLTVDLT